jgi:hypothetical protein
MTSQTWSVRVARMFEYDSVSSSAYDVKALIGKLNERASEGWEVVSIVPTGGDITAILQRSQPDEKKGATEALSAAATKGDAAKDEAGDKTAAAAGAMAGAAGASRESSTPSSRPEGVQEPPGWGTAPGPDREGAGAGAVIGGPAVAAGSSPSSSGAGAPPSASTAPGAASTPGPAASSAAAGRPTTPAGWYPDPSRRYEMRYWDGDKWTEHVSRQGQTHTDPPVA